MSKANLEKTEILNCFWTSPEAAVFDEKVISIIISRSVSTLQRARWAGFGGPAFIKIGRSIRYRKLDVVQYLESHQSFQSTCHSQQSQGNVHA